MGGCWGHQGQRERESQTIRKEAHFISVYRLCIIFQSKIFFHRWVFFFFFNLEVMPREAPRAPKMCTLVCPRLDAGCPGSSFPYSISFPGPRGSPRRCRKGLLSASAPEQPVTIKFFTLHLQPRAGPWGTRSHARQGVYPCGPSSPSRTLKLGTQAHGHSLHAPCGGPDPLLGRFPAL